ncbi:winged helix-turn-helix domain-containing protein (plasmid) [Leisingera aquaemixtae]|uniref:Winged helix-turn-helix domain-containing protein n=1 Tax=Leisingera aquaemixtae TaxID=1396826 RepID=A0ABY5WR87_9RHOB|nr:winged helix-turn-helix domain-containing protein [Leisingera aquaemixtae]UWQ43940.1 winged helix-turn-helix domain-containing protein [Leisingera aquaemixtae]
MDTYLDIAHKVLRASRRPMSAKGILDAAYRAHIVPEHLRGKTQHKTLQARLSEDILYHRSTSLFFRTEPGVFFLCEMISDPNIPEKYKEKFRARRRTRDLQTDSPLGISRRFLEKWRDHIEHTSVSDIFHAAELDEAIKYLPEAGDEDYASVWTFSLVRRGDKLLSYRIGRYRDDRDSFANKRTIGFPGAVTVRDRSLFSRQDYGAADNALNVLLLDLDLSPQSFSGEQIEKPKPIFAFEAEGEDGISVILVVLEWTCPSWFEPTTKRLSLNDPNWLEATVVPNNWNDFEPWSRTALRRVRERGFTAA